MSTGRQPNKSWVLVTGAGGFIGNRLVSYLKETGYSVRGADVRYPQFGKSAADEFVIADLRDYENCVTSTTDMRHVYHLAADIGGAGYVRTSHADISRNNSLMNLNMLEAARVNDVERFLFSSSACVYPQFLQNSPQASPLKEIDAWPAEPEEGYGLEKLYMEKLCQYYREDHELPTRVVRFHNVYGPNGIYDGGREKAPAAMCRKVALAAHGSSITIWGDGRQTRSFMHVDDCVEGIHRIMMSEYYGPLNLGTDELVTIDDLARIVVEASGKSLALEHDRRKPQGVRGRNGDNSLLRKILKWEPTTPLRQGIVPTYRWIADQVVASATRAPVSAAAE